AQLPFSALGQAEGENPLFGAAPAAAVSWQLRADSVAPGVLELVVTATPDEGWHLYSQYQNGIAVPLRLSLLPDAAFSQAPADSLWTEPDYIERHDELLNDTERYFEGEAVFRHRVYRQTGDPFTLTCQVRGQVCRDGACQPVDEQLQVAVGAGQPYTQPLPDSRDASSESLWWFFLLAFGGGLLGLLTPCVFPMIPMTVSYFMHHGGKLQAFFYGISIVLIYVVVGVVLSLIFGQGFANALSTHWIPNILFAVIFTVFALSLFGYFEIRLPSKWVNGSSKNEEGAGYLGTFFMALTLVLVSFSCTLPIAGAVALGAAGGGLLKPLVGMLGFSLAFALPFTLFAFFPSWLGRLPKSGGWMNTLKVCLAFVELAFAFKFLSVPDQAYQWHLLDREIYLAIWIVIFSLLGLYLLGKLRFPLDAEMPVQHSWLRFGSAIAVWVFVVYMIPGMFGAPLKALSGWLPPMSTQDFVLGASEHPSAPAADGMLSGIRNYDEALEVARKAGKPLFLDFTGYGCANCRMVEQAVFTDQRVRQMLQDDLVVATLYVDDKRDTQTSARNREVQNTVYRQNSQPCYLVIDPNDGRVLSGPVFFETDVEKFLSFLTSGRDSFREND
ncbi:MAG: thioredoxin family protein, partial [Paludibacteraceae bacterium]|nr:thioredoxin family protein [Paludibacteraceae bacterium]